MSSNIQNGTRYAQSGKGPVVVLIHGLGLNHDMWQWQRDVLSQHYTVVSYDLLGHGQSNKPRGAYTMQMMVDQLHQLMNDLGHARYALLGFSLGGLIVQAYALQFPQCVSALGVLHSAYGRTPEQREGILKRVQQCREQGPSATIDDALKRWFTSEFQQRDVIKLIRTWVLANDRDVYPELYLLLANADIGLETSVREILCPVLVATGEEDYGNSPEMAKRMADMLPNATVTVLEGLRHMALAEAPERFNAMLLDFLSSVDELAVKTSGIGTIS